MELQINEKPEKNVQIVSSAESPDLWKMTCLKSEAQYVFRDNFERAYPSDIGNIHAFLCNQSLYSLVLKLIQKIELYIFTEPH